MERSTQVSLRKACYRLAKHACSKHASWQCAIAPSSGLRSYAVERVARPLLRHFFSTPSVSLPSPPYLVVGSLPGALAQGMGDAVLASDARPVMPGVGLQVGVQGVFGLCLFRFVSQALVVAAGRGLELEGARAITWPSARLCCVLPCRSIFTGSSHPLRSAA